MILPSVSKDGYDPNRPLPGLVCEARSPEIVKPLVAHNEKLCNSSSLMPPLFPDLIRYECLAATHLNVGLRLGQNCSYSPAGDLAKIKEEDAEWAKACTQGHRWIILPESLDASLKADICTWRNQDQNENQPLTDGEIMRLCKISVD